MGVIVANWLTGKLEGVERCNDKVMKVNLLLTIYLGITSEKLLVDVDFNGHVGSDMGGFGEVYGGLGFRIGKINDEGIKLIN